jgi:hypothetical protein
MSTVVSTGVMPRSVLRHRPINQDHPEVCEVAYVTPRASVSRSKTLQKRKSMPQSAPTGTGPFVTKRTARTESRLHWSVLVGATMLGMCLVLWLVQSLWAWGTVVYDNFHYGQPRTMQVDAFVGHESGSTPSHFIALNLHGRVEVIELPGGDAAHARIFLGPQLYGPNVDLVPVTIQFIASPQHTHQPDMQVTFQGAHIMFLNEHGTFVPESNLAESQKAVP